MNADSFFLETYGCTLNTSDSEVIARILEKEGLVQTSSVKDATFIVINTCGVKTPTEQKILHQIRQLARAPGKILIICGCLPLIHKYDLETISRLVPEFGAMVGPKNYHELGAVIAALRGGKRNILKIDAVSLEHKYHLEQKRSRGHIGIVAIAEGCLGACNYCCTRFARGSLLSYPAKLLTGKFNALIDGGAKEIWVTAEDCSAYHDKGENMDLPGLLNGFLKKPGQYFVRLGMMNPATLLPVHGDLISSLLDDRVFKFIHVPVQAGSDRVLESMNRRYRVADFKAILAAFTAAYPGITLATDIICGYPGETDEDFDQTVRLMREVKPDVINISMYGHRPGTVASRQKQLPSPVVKERSRQLTALHKEITAEIHKIWIGWEGMAIIDEYNSENGNWVARNPFYRPIVLPRGHLGDIVRVKIAAAVGYYFTGEIIDG
nr:tRNA (N(6)-L-threonylcarbamoyladenosine(37)-C(2))-methylthiotransferase [Candidatus Sigynarchaeota archaeon]